MGGGGGFVDPPPPTVFLVFKFLPLDQLPNTFAQLFLDNEDIFWHKLNDVIILLDGKWSLLSNFQFFEQKWLYTCSYSYISTYIIGFDI